jgi:Phosphodiesterase/alkaline phosphatase D
MLGGDQWKWLEEALKRDADLRILGTSIQLLAEGHGWECWGNLPLERQRLLNLLAKYSKSNLIVISGDRHLGGMYSLRTNEGIEFLEITSSSMNKPGRNTNESGPLRIGEMYAGENFGLIRIDFQRKRANIELHGLNKGVVLSKTIHFDKPVLKGTGL